MFYNFPKPDVAAESPETNLEVNSRIIIAGKINTIDIAAVKAGLPEDEVENTNKGKVIIFPAPIKKVNKYWLQETKKANKAATTKPGEIAGRVIK